MQAGGYKQKQYWVSPAGDDEGWRWVTYRNATHPSFWVAPKALAEYHGGLPDRPYQKDDGGFFPLLLVACGLRSYCCLVRGRLAPCAWLFGSVSITCIFSARVCPPPSPFAPVRRLGGCWQWV